MSAAPRLREALPSDELDLHFYLMRAMARRHGVDLSAAMQAGILSRADFAAMIVRCRDCTGAPGDCREHAEDEAEGAAAPPWCANAGILDGLRGLV